jgi:hypothetical protein
MNEEAQKARSFSPGNPFQLGLISHAKDKRSASLGLFVSDEQKKDYNIWPRGHPDKKTPINLSNHVYINLVTILLN